MEELNEKQGTLDKRRRAMCCHDLLTSIPVGCVPHRCEWGMLERAGHAGRSAERDRQRDKKLQT